MIVGVMTVGVLSVAVMTLSQQLYTNTSDRISVSCLCTSELRDGFWHHKINNIGDFMSSVYLHRLSDCDTFDILAGTYISFNVANEEELDV